MGLMLQGILNMPLPDDPAKLDVMTWLQIKDRMRQAASELGRLQGLLEDRGIDPQSEYICTCGVRREPKRGEPQF